MSWLNEFEVGLIRGLYDIFGCPALDKFFPIVTSFCDAGIFWIALAVLFIFFKKTRRAGITMLIALGMGLIICNVILKPSIARIRPYDFDISLRALMVVEGEHDFSFPSGHTIASVEAAFALWLNNKKLGTPALVFAGLIAFSRLYLLLHYPSDVLASIVLGIAIAFAAFAIAKWFVKTTKIPCAE